MNKNIVLLLASMAVLLVGCSSAPAPAPAPAPATVIVITTVTPSPVILNTQALDALQNQIKVQKQQASTIWTNLDKEPAKRIYYISQADKKYHSPFCKLLSEEKTEITQGEAGSKGYTPDKACLPVEYAEYINIRRLAAQGNALK